MRVRRLIIGRFGFERLGPGRNSQSTSESTNILIATKEARSRDSTIWLHIQLRTFLPFSLVKYGSVRHEYPAIRPWGQGLGGALLSDTQQLVIGIGLGSDLPLSVQVNPPYLQVMSIAIR
jgi:hypothetical protein